MKTGVDPATMARPGSFFHSLASAERVVLGDHAHRRVFASDGQLISEGDSSGHVVIVLHGWAKASIGTEAGSRIFLRIYGPGDIVGSEAFLPDQPRRESVYAVGKLNGLVIPGSRFAKILDEQPQIWRILAEQVHQQLHRAVQRLQAKADIDVTRRLAQSLLDLGEQHGVHKLNGLQLPIPLSPAELASLIDASREKVGKALRVLQGMDLISTRQPRIGIPDLEALRYYAQFHVSGAPELLAVPPSGRHDRSPLVRKSAPFSPVYKPASPVYKPGRKGVVRTHASEGRHTLPGEAGRRSDRLGDSGIDQAAVDAFTAQLRDLRSVCGQPGIRELARVSWHVVEASGKRSRNFPTLSPTSLSDVLNRRRKKLPTWNWVAVFVLSCQRYAAESGLYADDPGESTLPEWNRRLQTSRAQCAMTGGEPPPPPAVPGGEASPP